MPPPYGGFLPSGMRRSILILVLLILPFQFSWAAAARYCLHEQVSASWHLGHHEHRHQQADARPDATDVEKKLVLDTDCGVCHIVSLPFVYAEPLEVPGAARAELVGHVPPADFTSLNARAPDRPQWLRLA